MSVMGIYQQLRIIAVTLERKLARLTDSSALISVLGPVSPSALD